LIIVVVALVGTARSQRNGERLGTLVVVVPVVILCRAREAKKVGASEHTHRVLVPGSYSIRCLLAVINYGAHRVFIRCRGRVAKKVGVSYLSFIIWYAALLFYVGHGKKKFGTSSWS
jgi:hypothetical protein